MALLEVRNINTYYGESHILFDVSMEVNEGQVVCLLGRNGAGKSTTMRSIVGMAPPRSGSITFRGTELANMSSFAIARLGLGYVPEDRRIFPNLSVRENLEVGRKMGKEVQNMVWTVEKVFELFPVLREIIHRKGGHLSGGEQQMLSIARTLMGNPGLLLLDEPSEGLAPAVVKMLKEQLKKLQEGGITIILAEQNLRFVRGLGDRVYILEKGMVRYQGTMQKFLADEEIRHAYLAV